MDGKGLWTGQANVEKDGKKAGAPFIMHLLALRPA
jgi:hypothetical protein